SWDYFFGKRRPCWVLVHLKTGGLVAGLMGAKSFASSYPEQRDLYLEEAWQITEDGRLEAPVPGTLGLWVHGEAFHMLEFLGPAEGVAKQYEPEV
ncbi:MAG: DUF6338 family protein, partial [Firmicutes bacterium]|nr:DUF6338 family protein [Bacillota bacterium]